jgi:phospholipid/cholesterol/gamma-HCH transport system ATP-binding protein
MEINSLIMEIRDRYNTSSIVITHDLTCAKETGDRQAVLLDGQFKAIGTFDEVFARADDQRVKLFYDYNFIDL